MMVRGQEHSLHEISLSLFGWTYLGCLAAKWL